MVTVRGGEGERDRQSETEEQQRKKKWAKTYRGQRRSGASFYPRDEGQLLPFSNGRGLNLGQPVVLWAQMKRRSLCRKGSLSDCEQHG